MFKRSLALLGILVVASGLCLSPGQDREAGRKTNNVLFGELRQICRRHFHDTGGRSIPFLPTPWHGAQYCVNISFPEVGFVGLIDGRFPANSVATILKFGNGSGAHGSAEMHVWGPLLESLDKYHEAAGATHQQSRELHPDVARKII